MNSDEARLLGMHIGDGSLYKTGTNSIVWEIRGSKEERDFYDLFVCMLLKRVFNIGLKAKNRSGGAHGCYGIQTCNKDIINFFLNNEVKAGSKLYTSEIPLKIKTSSRAIKCAFIGGLFDTDGCVRLEKNRTKRYYYPKIEFGFASQKLSRDLFLLLSELGFKAYKWRDKEYFKICLAGFDNLKKWFKEIKPMNSKHFKRISALKDYAPMAQWYGADLFRKI